QTCALPILARKPGGLRNGAPFREWVLPSAMEKIRRKLKAAEDGDRQTVSILTCVLTDRIDAVEAACQEALDQGVSSADMILNILARSRDPAPCEILSIPQTLKLYGMRSAYDEIMSVAIKRQHEPP